MIALTVSLGRWQSERAQEKQARQSLLEARSREAPVVLGASSGPAEALVFRRVRATGRWIAQGQIFIDNQIRDARAGFHVVTPLRLKGTSTAVLVNRGWIAREAGSPRPPHVPVSEGDVEVVGLATRPPARVLELSPETISGSVWQNLSLEKYAQRTGTPLLPVVVLAETPAPGLAPVTERPDAGVLKHREYALTWFSLAATLAVLWIYFGFRRTPP